MKILGDIGNTETKICLVNTQNKVIKKLILKTNNINFKILEKRFLKFKLNKININKSLFCSVVPKVFYIFKNFLKKKYDLNIHELKKLKLSSILKIKVNYKQVGSDRLANAIGLVNNKDNFIILDFGTATTFDVLIKKTYHGGIIAPGVQLSLNTLINKASLIPILKLKKVSKVIGNNTINAVRSGFFWGYSGLIDNIINLIKKETKCSFKIIITGGFSNLFRKSIKTKFIHNKDLTIEGLIKASNLIK